MDTYLFNMGTTKNNKSVNFTIRDIEKNDSKDVIKNYYSRYDEAKRNPFFGMRLLNKKPSINEETKWFNGLLNRIKSGNSLAFVAEVDDKIIGICTLTPKTQYIENHHIGTIGLHVNENYRSVGIGRALMNCAIKKAKTKFRIIDLEVVNLNDHGLDLYKKLGFKEYGRFPKSFIRGEVKLDTVLMYLKL